MVICSDVDRKVMFNVGLQGMLSEAVIMTLKACRSVETPDFQWSTTMRSRLLFRIEKVMSLGSGFHTLTDWFSPAGLETLDLLAARVEDGGGTNPEMTLKGESRTPRVLDLRTKLDGSFRSMMITMIYFDIHYIIYIYIYLRVSLRFNFCLR